MLGLLVSLCDHLTVDNSVCPPTGSLQFSTAVCSSLSPSIVSFDQTSVRLTFITSGICYHLRIFNGCICCGLLLNSTHRLIKSYILTMNHSADIRPNRYPFLLLEYPRKMYLQALASNFWHSSWGMCE